jgi:hypothetical protein
VEAARTKALSFHTPYACRHAGACCQADWEIDVEPLIVHRLETRQVVPVAPGPLNLPTVEVEEDGRTVYRLPRRPDGRCGFRHEARCSLQVAGGEPMLPSACRHFPRVFLRDTRGTFVTLSHFCPTAASLLFDDHDVRIVDAPDGLALAEPIEGLDARAALPPLLCPGMLMDPEGYGAWEAGAVETFAECSDVDTALLRIASATELVRLWTPQNGRLSDAVRAAYRQARIADHRYVAAAFDLARRLMGPHPLMQAPPDAPAIWERVMESTGSVMQRALARYLAASTFGNWMAYRGQGLRTVVYWLRACHDVVRLQIVRQFATGSGNPRDRLTEAFRMADLLLVHTIDSAEFGRRAAAIER